MLATKRMIARDRSIALRNSDRDVVRGSPEMAIANVRGLGFGVEDAATNARHMHRRPLAWWYGAVWLRMGVTGSSLRMGVLVVVACLPAYRKQTRAADDSRCRSGDDHSDLLVF